MKVVETCSGSATPPVSGSTAPSACAAMVRGFENLDDSEDSVMARSERDHIRAPMSCKTLSRTQHAGYGNDRVSGEGDGERACLLWRADRDRRGRRRAAARPHQHD